jgi:hypothetical protein
LIKSILAYRIRRLHTVNNVRKKPRNALTCRRTVDVAGGQEGEKVNIIYAKLIKVISINFNG